MQSKQRSYRCEIPIFIVNWTKLLEHLRTFFNRERDMQGFKKDFFKWCDNIVECISCIDRNRDSFLGSFFEGKRFIEKYKFKTSEQLEEIRAESFLLMSWASPFVHPPHKKIGDADFKTVLGEACKRLFELIETVEEKPMEEDEHICFEVLRNVYDNFSAIYENGIPLNYEPQILVKTLPPKTTFKTTSYAKMVASNIEQVIDEKKIVPQIVEKIVPQIVEETVDENIEWHQLDMMHLKDGNVSLSHAMCTDDVFRSEYNPAKEGCDDESVIVHTLTIEGNVVKLVKVVTSFGIIRKMKMYKFRASPKDLTIFIDTETENNLKGNDKLTYKNDRIIIVQQISKSFNDNVYCIVQESLLSKK